MQGWKFVPSANSQCNQVLNLLLSFYAMRLESEEKRQKVDETDSKEDETKTGESSATMDTDANEKDSSNKPNDVSSPIKHRVLSVRCCFKSAWHACSTFVSVCLCFS